MSDFDVIVVGAGLAGMNAAIHLAPLRVLLIDGGTPASKMALGGVAGPISVEDVEAHVADTLAAGDGACDEDVVRSIIKDALPMLNTLEATGLFDEVYNHEGGHSLARVRRCDGDQTGKTVTGFFQSKLGSHITIVSGEICGLLQTEWLGRVCGVELVKDGQVTSVFASHVVLATGGIGARFDVTTNPDTAEGIGLELAARAGAVCRDLEYIQFHPTVLNVGGRSLPVMSEALRGAGAVLRNGHGELLMAHHVQKDLAPRDVVAKEVARADRGAFLDARGIDDFAARFPAARRALEAHKVKDLGRIPVRTAVHYHMGGVATDLEGRTSLEGLWACGEVACTGFHGANRLASNSLLEAIVMGTRVGDAIRATHGQYRSIGKHSVRMGDKRLNPEVLADAMAVVRWESTMQSALDACPKSDVLSRMMLRCAIARKESRGSHSRGEAWPRSIIHTPSLVTCSVVVAIPSSNSGEASGVGDQESVG